MQQTTSANTILKWLNSARDYDAGVKLYLQYGNDALLKKLFQEQPTSDFKKKKLNVVMEELMKVSKADKANKPVEIEASVKVSKWEKSQKSNESVNKKTITVKVERVDKSNESKKKASPLKKLEEKVEMIASTVDGLEYDQYDIEEEVIRIDNLESTTNKLSEEIEKLKKKGIPVSAGWPKDMDDELRSLYDEWLPKFIYKKNLQARIYDVALLGKKDEAEKRKAGEMAHKILDLRNECRAIYQKRDYYLEHKKMPEEKKLCDIPEDPKKWPLELQNAQRYVRDKKLKLKKLEPTEANKKKIDALTKKLEIYEWKINELKKLLGL
jgi:hypothetical protein